MAPSRPRVFSRGDPLARSTPPTEASSGGRQRLGSISKHGNAFLRFVLAEAAQSAAQGDPVLR
ncbi:MAG: transposase, partial [Terriglobales bacterium]